MWLGGWKLITCHIFFKQLPEEEAVLPLVEEAEGVVEAGVEEEEEGDLTTGSHNKNINISNCRILKVTVAFKILQTKNFFKLPRIIQM